MSRMKYVLTTCVLQMQACLSKLLYGCSNIAYRRGVAEQLGSSGWLDRQSCNAGPPQAMSSPPGRP
eukprot:3993334-Amphidinium_carterae.1